MKPTDQLILGAGVIGLSVAYELASRGSTVRILDRGKAGKQTSWAAAGILPAVPPQDTPNAGRDAYEQFRNISGHMFPDWLERLQADSGVDPEHDPAGALHLAGGSAEAAALAVDLAEWKEEGLTIEPLTAESVAECEPALSAAVASNRISAAYRLPDESMLRTPRYLDALRAGCEARGVDIVENAEVTEWKQNHDDDLPKFVSAKVNDEECVADQFCLATGVWSGATAKSWELSLDIRPWRGQMLLLESPKDLPRLTQVINEGPKYLVPRRDGHILVGSTVEDVGFDFENTDAVIAQLHEFAAHWIPALEDAREVARWAGLRPGTGDGCPYLGRMTRVSNAFVATGHFRSGVFLSPATATVMSQLMLGEPTAVDLNDFRLERK